MQAPFGNSSLCPLLIGRAHHLNALQRLLAATKAGLLALADWLRALAFERSNARAGEKPVGALVVFQGVEAREATPQERKQLQEARKAQKLQAKQRRAARQAEKQAGKDATIAVIGSLPRVFSQQRQRSARC